MMESNLQRLAQRLLCRLVDSGEGMGHPQDRQKMRPVSANLCLKVSKPALCGFDSFLKAANQEESIGQPVNCPYDCLSIRQIDINFERFAEIGHHHLP